MLTFRILGPLEISTPARTVRLRGSLQRGLLMVLLANARKIVSTESLITELWADTHPDNVENALHAHVSRLRQRLASYEPSSERSRLITYPSGYQLMVSDEELDACVFAARLDEIGGRRQDDPAAAVPELRLLLAMWRGQVFGGLAETPLCMAAGARYEELRLAALELLFDGELCAGNHLRIIPELREVLVEHSYKERFHQQLMIALYRSGRQADALDVYRELRRRLTDDLGIEPSPRMRGYERAVLDHDPVLELPFQRDGRAVPLMA
ncbi:MAG TPA: AfsR/SARP family transcriptional regulator [Pseudonocardiaceae bacterium]|jgi:DNA-binding SARP family transcriptional activator|nr:AfsR/SARP family transcriptional regulator [Pseudonocardiaceae bacterium]